MIQTIRKSMCLMLFAGSIATLAAAPPILGFARSRGRFLLNNAAVPGSATILDGSSVRTQLYPSDVSLSSGERLTLAPATAASFRRDRLILETGNAELSSPSAYLIEARGLRISASGAGTLVRVSVSGGDAVHVASLGGMAEVHSAQGSLVARVLSGMTIQLQPAAEASDAVTATGTLRREGEVYTLEEETTHVKMELRGAGLQSLVGKRIHVMGTAMTGVKPATTATLVVKVAQAARQDKRAAVAAVAVAGTAASTGTATAAAGTAAAGAATASGITVTTVAVVGAAAAGATVGGLAAAGTLSGTADPVSR